MGLNISIETKDAALHPDWDYLRYGGDREFASAFLAGDVAHEMWTPDGFPYADDRYLYRPTDLAAFRAFGAAQENPTRWAKAADILEASPDHWLHFSW